MKQKYDSSKLNEVVVLLHGACKNKKQMRYIRNLLHELGYRIYDIEYNSRQTELKKIVKEALIKVQHVAGNYQKIHFIGHSLGGLIIRSVLTRYKPNNLGKVIQIATPNQGSKLAGRFKDKWFYKKVYGNVSKDLIPDSDFLSSLEPSVSYELGVIAGYSSNLITKWLLGFELSDGRVGVDDTRLEGMKDRIIIKENHNQIVRSFETLYQIKMFMFNGRFNYKRKKVLNDSKN